ncbi:hypothetical protein D3C75_1165680 [compost metagenome]
MDKALTAREFCPHSPQCNRPPDPPAAQLLRGSVLSAPGTPRHNAEAHPAASPSPDSSSQDRHESGAGDQISPAAEAPAECRAAHIPQVSLPRGRSARGGYDNRSACFQAPLLPNRGAAVHVGHSARP